MSIPEDLAPDELTDEKVRELLEAPSGDRELGTDPESGHPVVVKAGRYGPYVTTVVPEGSKEAPRTGSLFASMSPETVTIDDALKLLSLPRVVGVDPESGDEITELVVDGDRATAKVHWHYDKTPDDVNVVDTIVVRENGEWKVCTS